MSVTKERTEFSKRWSSAPHTMGHWPINVKPHLMDLPQPLWHLIYPLWRRWYWAWMKLPLWQTGSYKLGQAVYWRGVRLICCTEHFAGHMADHPWDPGAGWPAARANALWEPATPFNRWLLSIVGDPRRPA